jgi:hypothetical protein
LINEPESDEIFFGILLLCIKIFSMASVTIFPFLFFKARPNTNFEKQSITNKINL